MEEEGGLCELNFHCPGCISAVHTGPSVSIAKWIASEGSGAFVSLPHFSTPAAGWLLSSYAPISRGGGGYKVVWFRLGGGGATFLPAQAYIHPFSLVPPVNGWKCREYCLVGHLSPCAAWPRLMHSRRPKIQHATYQHTLGVSERELLCEPESWSNLLNTDENFLFNLCRKWAFLLVQPSRLSPWKASQHSKCYSFFKYGYYIVKKNLSSLTLILLVNVVYSVHSLAPT